MKQLPAKPNIEYLKREAQVLKARHRARDKSACAVIGHFDTSKQQLSDEQIFAGKFSILDAQRVTARQYSFSSWSRLKAFVDKSSNKGVNFNSEQSNLLISKNQTLETLLNHARATPRNPESLKQVEAFAAESGETIANIYRQSGWPGPAVVGREGVEACFYLAASCVHDSSFQHMTAELLQEAMRKGDCYGMHYAVIKDRWLALSYQPTIYGVMSDFNDQTGRVELTRDVIEPDRLNQRRAEVGLGYFESENRKLVGELHRTGQLQTDHKDWQRYKRDTAIRGGYIHV
jgi:hypothetical protein